MSKKGREFDHSHYQTWVDPNELIPYPKNAKQHDKAQVNTNVTKKQIITDGRQGGIMISIKRNVPVVYFISDGQGHCKIGVASDIQNRFITLQVGSAYELTITHLIYTETLDEAYDLEREYHSALCEYNIRGEWYDENIVENYYKYGTIEKKDKIYMCDVCPEFDIQDAGKLFMVLLSSKTVEEAQERYEREMPEYWKQYDIDCWEKFTGEKAVLING